MQQSNQGNAEGTKFTGGNGPGDAASFVEVEMAVNGLENDSFQGPSRLTSRTVLSVLAVNVIYFAHLVNLVGAGAVSRLRLLKRQRNFNAFLTAKPSYSRKCRVPRQRCMDPWSDYYHDRCARSGGFSGG